MTKDEIRRQYRREMLWGMRIFAVFYAISTVGPFLLMDNWWAFFGPLLAIGWWEIMCWMVSIEPTEQWLKDSGYDR